MKLVNPFVVLLIVVVVVDSAEFVESRSERDFATSIKRVVGKFANANWGRR